MLPSIFCTRFITSGPESFDSSVFIGSCAAAPFFFVLMDMVHVAVFVIYHVCIFQLCSYVAWHCNVDIAFLYYVSIVLLYCDTTV